MSRSSVRTQPVSWASEQSLPPASLQSFSPASPARHHRKTSYGTEDLPTCRHIKHTCTYLSILVNPDILE